MGGKKRTHNIIRNELWIIFEWHGYLRQREKYEMSVQKLAVSFFRIYSMYKWYMYAIVEPVSKKQMKALIMCVKTRLTNNMPRNEMLWAQAHFSLFSLLSLLYAIHYNNFHENHSEPYFFFFSTFSTNNFSPYSSLPFVFVLYTIWKFPFVHLGAYIMNSLR